MAKKTWTITYLNDTPSLEIEAESLVKAVEKVKDKLADADLSGAVLSGADLVRAVLSGAILHGAYLDGAKGLPRLG